MVPCEDCGQLSSFSFSHFVFKVKYLKERVYNAVEIEVYTLSCNSIFPRLKEKKEKQIHEKEAIVGMWNKQAFNKTSRI